MIKKLLLLSLIACGGAVWSAKVGIVTSNYNQEFRALAASKAWRTERLPSGNMTQWGARLGEFDLLINSTASYKNMTTPWSQIGPQMKKYLSDGGILVLLSAFAPASQQQVIGHFGPEFKLRYGNCKTHQDQQHLTRRKWNSQLRVNFFPNDLAAAFQDHYGLWMHYFGPPRNSKWQVMARCHKNFPVMLIRPVGRGFIVCTTYSYFTPARQKPLHALVENLLAMRQLTQAGVELPALSHQVQYGDNQFKAPFKVTQNRPGCLQWTISQSGKILARKQVKFNGAGYYKFAVNYRILQAGAVQFQLQIKVADQTYEIQLLREVPQELTCLPWRQDVYPRIAAQFPVEVQCAPGIAPKLYNVNFFYGKQKLSAIPQAENRYALDLRQLPAGKCQLRAELIERASGTRIRTQNFTLLVLRRDPPHCVGLDNTMYIKGQAVFPLGFYVLRGNFPAQVWHQAVDFAAATAPGLFLFTAQRTPGKIDPEFERFAAYAAQKAVRIRLAQLPPRPTPSVIGCGVADEPDGWHQGDSQYLSRALKLRQQAPELFTTIVLMKRLGFTARNLRAADWVGHDPYPLYQNPISMVYYNIKELVDLLAGTSHVPVVIPQAFGYPNHPFFKLPRVAEIRNMTYQAVVAGARGVIFYTYLDSKFALKTHPEHAAELQREIREIKQWETLLLKGEYRRIKTSVPGVFAAQWQYDKRTLKIYVNTNRQKVQVDGLNLTPLEVNISQL